MPAAGCPQLPATGKRCAHRACTSQRCVWCIPQNPRFTTGRQARPLHSHLSIATRDFSLRKAVIDSGSSKIRSFIAQIVTMTDSRIFNDTFNPGTAGTGRYNACVGNNGFVDSRSYGDGFAEAVDILTSALEANDDRGQLDTLIYPICFCARHHVELFLKEQIVVIGRMRHIPPPVSIVGTHDLRNLWDALVMVATKTDKRFSELLDQMRMTISDIAQIDPTGQTFRYPTNVESAKHLVLTPVINVPTLRRKFMALAERIRDFEHLGDALAEEYRLGTVTTKLSRRDIEYVAKALPRRETWATTPEFDETKARLMAELAISSNDFRRALCVIQDHREFCAHIGMNRPIPNLDVSSLDRLNLLFNEQIQIEEMPKAELIAFSAIFELSLSSYYSEDYEAVERNFAADFDLNEYKSTQASLWARRLSRLANGLRKVGQPHLAEHLEHNVDPTAFIKRLDKASEDFASWRARIRDGKARAPDSAKDGAEPPLEGG